MGGCPKCGGPVADTDLACRQCGVSFVPDVSAAKLDPYQSAYNSGARLPPSQPGAHYVPPPPPFAASAAFEPSAALPVSSAYVPPAPPAPQAASYAYTPAPIAGSSSEASSALLYAIVGFFCFGFAFGFVAIKKAKAAKITIAQNPGMTGGEIATVAYYLGWFDAFGWILYLLRVLAGAGRGHG